jgi:hypothetical protein
MLGVILLILKVIGILLLAVLGLLLVMILIVLFTPIRYRIKFEHGEELLILDSKVSWLFHIVRARVSHMNGVFHILVKVLWFTIYDNLQPRKHKPEKRKKAVQQKKGKKSVKVKKESKKINKLKTEQNIKNHKSSDITNEKQDTINEKTVSRVRKTILVDKVDNEKAIVEKQKIEQNIKSEEVIKSEENTKSVENIKSVESIKSEEIIKSIENVKSEENITDIEKKNGVEKTSISIVHMDNEEKASLFKRIYIKIKVVKDKVVASIRNFIERIKIIFESIHNIKSKLDLILDFIRKEANKEGFKITFASIKKIVKHILPKEFKSKIRFGTGDPCSTGQALGALGMLYSIYGDNIQITPDFENKVLEGKHYARGRIRLITIIIIVIKLILDKRFKQLTKNVVILKEAL